MKAGRAMSRRRSRIVFAVACALCVLGALPRVSVARQYSPDAVKAAFLYRFAGYVVWPHSALAMKRFTIAVLGAPDVAMQLQRLLPDHQIKHLPAQVRRIERIKDLDGAQILYIGPRHRRSLRTIIAAVGTRPVLIVTDDAQGLNDGGTVNFLLINHRVRFEVSLAAARHSGLKISSGLLSVAARVEGGRLSPDSICALSLQLSDGPTACAAPVRVAAAAGGAMRLLWDDKSTDAPTLYPYRPRGGRDRPERAGAG